jgi:glycosyltransferase involved in cell wall biosynthesis
MAKILIYGNANSQLVKNRGLIGQKGGHQIFWISPLKVILPGVTSFGLPGYVFQGRYLRAILEPFLVWRVIRRVKPDLVHVHYASKGLGAIPLMGKTPLIVSVMGSDILPEAGFRGIYAPFTRLLLNHADVITSKSEYLDKALIKIGNYRKKIVRVAWGVDLTVFKPGRETKSWRRELKIPSDHYVFFEPRSARPLYNKHVVINAFSKYQKLGGPPAILLMATGSPDQTYLRDLRAQIGKLGLTDRVRFLDLISAEDMADLFCLANTIISTPQSDGFPQSFLEALACGRELLIGDLPQYTEITKTYVGIETVPTGDTNALADKMLAVARQPPKNKSGKSGNRRTLNLKANLVHENQLVLELYADLLKEHG